MEDDEERRISSGTACVVVSDRSLEDGDADFYKWLRSHGFKSWGHKGNFGMSWVFVNLYSKIYAPGMPGIMIARPMCENGISIDEFMEIYDILERHNVERDW